MQRFFKVTTLLMALLVMSATAWSFNSTDHVSQAPNGKGDVLIYPVYFGFEGFQTKIQVVNTSLEMSAVAKVVVRSPLYSQEVLDFFIFLSPTDVWEGFIRWNAQTGQPEMYSEDPSSLIGIEPTFASAADPLQVSLADPRCGDTNLYGYAEVFLTWVLPGDTPGKTKTSIFERFIGDGTVLNPAPTAGFAPGSDDALLYFCKEEENGNNGVTSANGMYWYDADYCSLNTNILAGNQQIQSPLLGWTSALNATTLKDYRIEIAAGLAETAFGSAARNSITEVEAALSKNEIGMPYINDAEGRTFHFFTFPTKLTLLDADCNVTPRGRYAGFDKVTYTVRPMDMEENTVTGPGPIFSPFDPEQENKFPYEVNALVPGAFDKGWYLYRLDNGPTLGDVADPQWEEFYCDQDENCTYNLKYTGAPVIPMVMNFGAGGFSTMYGFWSDGEVSDYIRYTEEGEVVYEYDLPMKGYQYIRTHFPYFF